MFCMFEICEWLEFTKTVSFGLDFFPTDQFMEINFVTTKFNSKKLIHIYFPLCQADINGIPFVNHGQRPKNEHMERHEASGSLSTPMSQLQNKTTAVDLLKAKRCLGSG